MGERHDNETGQTSQVGLHGARLFGNQAMKKEGKQEYWFWKQTIGSLCENLAPYYIKGCEKLKISPHFHIMFFSTYSRAHEKPLRVRDARL